jgi:hypothetical protein
MKKVFLVQLLLAWVCIENHAQTVTYNHDESVMNQVTIQETGSGSFTPDTYYDVFHKDYRNYAARDNKLTFRTLVVAAEKRQEPYAEEIDSALTKRAKVEALNLADRQVDAVWLVEKDKVMDALDTFKSNIEKITLSGGTYRAYENWVEIYNMLVCGLNYIKNSYLPNSERQEQYLEIYNDVKSRNKKLARLLAFWKERKSIVWSGRELKRKDDLIKNSGSNALTRWKLAAINARGNKQ